MSKVPMSTRIRNKARDVRHHVRVGLIGTKANEQDWAERGVDQFYWSSIDHPHRSLLVKAVCGFSPTSVLEIGCNSGPNLYRLSKECPTLKRLEGIDLSQVALEEGQRHFREEGMDNVHLQFGKADDLQQYADGSFDVVFSDAVMIYVGKDKIDQVRDEMLRVAKKGIVLVEWNENEAGQKGKYLYRKGYWIRNYEDLFRASPSVSGVKLTKITSDVWNDAMWSRYGYVVEVTKRDVA